MFFFKLNAHPGVSAGHSWVLESHELRCCLKFYFLCRTLQFDVWVLKKNVRLKLCFGTPIQVMHLGGTDCKALACHLLGRGMLSI